MSESKNEYLLKISIIGSPDKLKTEFIKSFAEYQLPDHSYMHGVIINTKKIQVDDNNVKLILAETSEKEFYRKLRLSYYRGASGAVICYEKTNDGLKAATYWYNDFRKHITSSNIPVTLVCINTGSDELITSAGQLLAKQFNAKYYELTPRPKPPKSRYLDERRKRKRFLIFNKDECENIFRDITRRALETK